jgi:hypothetical protein
VEEEEVERREATCIKKSEGGTIGGGMSTESSTDQADQTQGGDKGDHDVHDLMQEGDSEGAEVRIADPWLSQADDDVHDNEDPTEEVDINKADRRD